MIQYRSARRIRPRRTERRSSVRFLITLLLTTSMIATGGFGTFPENSITQAFQEEIGQNFPPEFLNPINSYLESLPAPTIQPQPASDSESASPLDIVGLLFGTIPVTESTAPTELGISSEELTSTLISAQTETAFASSTSTISPTLTLTAIFTNTITPTASATISASATWTVPPVIIFPTSTQRPIPANTATSMFTATNPPTSTNTSTNTPTLTLTPTATQTFTNTPTSTVTLTPTLTPTNTFTPTPGNGSCVVNSPNTSTYGCLISNIRLNGVPQTSLTVLAGQNFTLEYDFQVWSDPACPTCAMQIIAGLEAASAPTCDYSGIPNVHPGVSGGSNVHTFSSATTGNKAIFIRWVQQAGCNVANYGGFGTVIALITVQ